MLRGTITWSESERWAKPSASARRAIVSMPWRVASAPRVGMVKPTSMMLFPPNGDGDGGHADGPATGFSGGTARRAPGDRGWRWAPPCRPGLLRAAPGQGILHDRREAEEKAHAAQTPRQP